MGKRTQPPADSDNGPVVKRNKSNARSSVSKAKSSAADVAQFFDIEATEDGFHTNDEGEVDEDEIVDAGEDVTVDGHPVSVAEDITAVTETTATYDAASDGSGHSAHSLAVRKLKASARNVIPDDDDEEEGGITEETTSRELETDAKDDGAKTVASASSKPSTSTGKSALVQAKLPKPDGSKGIDWGYQGKVNERINIARALASAKTDTYSFSTVPASLVWSKVMEPDKDPYYAVSVAGMQKPIRLWGVGHVTRTYFFTAGGDPPFSVSANVRLIHDNDNTVANTLLAQHTVPRLQQPLPYTDVRFGKWMAVRHPGDTMMTNDTFVDVYDARQGIKLPKTKMTQYPAQLLKKGDLVLVEATVVRYHPKVNGRTDPKKWNATYSLEFIALLADTPPPTTLAAKICDDELVINF